MCLGHTFGPASLPGGAGIPAFHAQRSRETHYFAPSKGTVMSEIERIGFWPKPR